MRFVRTMLSVMLVCCLFVVPASAQRVSIGVRLGTPRTVVTYDNRRDGEWRDNYRQWDPTTMYVLDGQYYDQPYGNSRAVIVYRNQHEGYSDYFLPPQDRAWVGADRRYDYKRKPKSADYNRSQNQNRNQNRNRRP